MQSKKVHSHAIYLFYPQVLRFFPFGLARLDLQYPDVADDLLTLLHEPVSLRTLKWTVN